MILLYQAENPLGRLGIRHLGEHPIFHDFHGNFCQFFRDFILFIKRGRQIDLPDPVRRRFQRHFSPLHDKTVLFFPGTVLFLQLYHLFYMAV